MANKQTKKHKHDTIGLVGLINKENEKEKKKQRYYDETTTS